MRQVSYDVLEPFISDKFTKSKFPPKPIIAVHSRDQRDTVNLIKNFYIKFPQYRWITFRDMRGLSEDDFAKGLNESFASVWLDSISSYGTFPLQEVLHVKSSVRLFEVLSQRYRSLLLQKIFLRHQILF